MKNFRWMLALATVVALAVAVSAQKPSDIYKGLKYDKTTEVKIHGTIEEVQEFECPVSGMEKSSAILGSHALIKTADGSIVVHIAPVKFMKEYGLEITKGDSVDIVGSKLKDSNGKDTILAREMVKDNTTLRFRDKTGRPSW